MRAGWIVSGVAFAAALALVVNPPRALRATCSLVATPSVVDAPAPRPSHDAPEKKTVSTTTTTGAALDPDIVARLDTIETAVRDGDIAALPVLAASDLAKEPEVAPAIIHALASLAAQGNGADHELAGKTLARWLREESRRGARDASGNVVNIVEALGDLGGDAAVIALIDALEDADRMLDLPLQTTTVQRLGVLGDRRALPAIERFATRVEKLPRSDDAFERELQDEATSAAASACAQLR